MANILNVPAIPPAMPTLASITATVNTMRQAVQILAGQQATQGRGVPPVGATGAAGPNVDRTGTWNELSRTTETVRIYQDNDQTSPNWVDIARINSLTMVNKDTGQKWTWNR